MTPEHARLTDEVRFFIESGEAELIRYGLFDVVTPVSDVVEHYKFSPELAQALGALTESQREQLLLQSVQDLVVQNVLLRFDSGDTATWRVRSRMGELVRLISKLRQRFEYHRLFTASKSLVQDIHYEVQPRQYPVRQQRRKEMLKALLLEGKAGLATREELLEVYKTLNQVRRDGGKLHSALPETYSEFQMSSLRHLGDWLFNGQATELKGLVVGAGTGAGKTNTFFIPALAYATLTKVVRGERGVKAIAIYPRQKLAQNQFETFLETLHFINKGRPQNRQLTIAIDYQGTLYDHKALTGDDPAKRGWARSGSHWIFPVSKCPVPNCGGTLGVRKQSAATSTPPLTCMKCGEIVPEVLYVREDWKATPPDFYIAVTESLNNRMLDSQFAFLFGEGTLAADPANASATLPSIPRLVMLDEIHLHVANKGMQIGYLTRRLLARLRRAAHKRAQEPCLTVMGLSATIAEPQSFFSKLTSLPEHQIEVVLPIAAELQRNGSEYFLFVKANPEDRVGAMSTMLQTNMVVSHTMPQPTDQPGRYLSLGFADSHDLVGRWHKQLTDADRYQQLFSLRDMTNPKAREAAWTYFRRDHNTSECQGCQSHPNLNCLVFREGECWWSMSHAANAHKGRLELGTETSKRVARPEDYLSKDQLIATSRLEVGFDDDRIMAVLQYQAPGDAASFIQRKGRAGRAYGTYPITVMVLNPYRPQDAFYFKNAHLLTAPVFRELPLNPGNALVQRIHGFYSMFEHWLSQALASERHISFGSLKPEAAHWIREWTGQASDLDDLLEVVRDTLQVDAVGAASLLSDAENGTVRVGLMQLLSGLDQASGYTKGPDLLNTYLPRNFFTDINLPQLDIQRGESFMGRSDNKPLDTLDLAMGLRTVLPGKVSWRGEDPFWVPPLLGGVVGLSGRYRQYVLGEEWMLDQLHPHESGQHVPRRLLQRLGLEPGRQFPVYRPRSVVVERCMPQRGVPNPARRSKWFLGDEYNKNDAAGSALRNVGLQETKVVLDERSVTYGLTFDSVNFPQQAMPANMEWVSTDSQVPVALGPFRGRLVKRVRLADHRVQPMKIRRLTLGGDMNLRWPGGAGYQETFAFLKDQEVCLLGYELSTEGMAFELPKHLPLLPHIAQQDSARNGPAWQRQLFEFQVKLAFQEQGLNAFTAERLLRALFTVWGQKPASERHTANMSGLLERNEWRDDISGVLTTVYRTRQETADEVMAMLDLPDTRTMLAQAWTDSLKVSERNNWSWDVQVSTLAQATLQAAQQHAGVEAGQQLAVWAPLRIDYGTSTSATLYLFEDGVGGLGIARSLHEQFRQWPLAFWDLLEHKLQHCSVGDEEDLLLGVLSLPEDELAALAQACLALHTAQGRREHQHALQKLKALARNSHGLDLTTPMIKALLRVFSAPLQVWGQELQNWKLYREINVTLRQAFEQAYAHHPNEAELTALALRWIEQGHAQIPELTAMSALLGSGREDKWETHVAQVQAAVKKPEVQQLLKQIQTRDELLALRALDAAARQQQLKQRYGMNLKDDLLVEFDLNYFDSDEHLHWAESCWAAVHGQLEQEKKQYLAQLDRTALQREMTRRTLNSCVLACPNCLESSAVSFGDRALLDRRMTARALVELRSHLDIPVAVDSRVDDLVNSAGKILRDGEKRCVFVFKLKEQALVNAAIAQLCAQGVRQEIGEYSVSIARTDLRDLGLPVQKPTYEVHLELRELR